MSEIDIIIPCLNSMDTIERALNSLNKQTNKDFSIIVVDDGSIDGTGQFAESYAKDHNLSLRLITHAKNLGTASAMNDGVKASDKSWITFLGSDDELEEGWLESMLELKERIKGYDVYACTAFLIEPDGFTKHYKEGMKSHEIMLSDIYIRNTILSSGCFVKRQMFEDMGGFTIGMYNEDYDLWIRTLSRGYRIYEEINPLYKYYIGRPGQVTADQRKIVVSSTEARLKLINSGQLEKKDVEGFIKGMRMCWVDYFTFEFSKRLNEKLTKKVSLINCVYLRKIFNIFSNVFPKILHRLLKPFFYVQSRIEIAKIKSKISVIN